MVTPLSNSFVRNAYRAAGEKRYALARIVYPYLLGPHWRWAIVGWAYIKCLDDLVDENESTLSALETLNTQKEILANAYTNDLPLRAYTPHETYGYRLYIWDRSLGGPLRESMQEIFEIMAFELQRRGSILSRKEIDTYLVRIGKVMIDFLFYFVAPKLTLPSNLYMAASRAYLYADTIMDLKHDIEYGLINIPDEDMNTFAIDLENDFEGLKPWVMARVPEIEGYFDEATHILRNLPLRIRMWGNLLLTQKRKAFRRFLNEENIH